MAFDHNFPINFRFFPLSFLSSNRYFIFPPHKTLSFFFVLMNFSLFFFFNIDLIAKKKVIFLELVLFELKLWHGWLLLWTSFSLLVPRFGYESYGLFTFEQHFKIFMYVRVTVMLRPLRLVRNSVGWENPPCVPHKFQM
jgi:hypothetical protein